MRGIASILVTFMILNQCAEGHNSLPGLFYSLSIMGRSWVVVRSLIVSILITGFLVSQVSVVDNKQ